MSSGNKWVMEEVTVTDIYRWCREKGVEPICSFVLIGPLNAVNDDLAVSAVGNFYGISQPCVVDRWKGQSGDTYAILISNRNPLDKTLIPLMVVVEGAVGGKVQVIWPEGEEMVAAEALSGGDSGTGPLLVVDSPPTADPQESSVNKEDVSGTGVEAVVDKMVSQLERWHYEGGYRRLRIFSGITPVPAGEETYDTWREAAIQHSEEWHCPEHIKKQRIVESLRGPAMRVIQATRRSKTTATLKDYIEALDFSYGTLEDVGDLLARLNRTYQEPGETLTHYIYRVDRLIYQIVDKGGIEKGAVDERRMRQVLKGAMTNHPVAQRLRCTMARGPPPTLTELVKEVKLEEIQIDTREKNIKRVKVVLPTPSPPKMDERLLKLIEEQNKKIDQLIALQSSPQSNTGWPVMRGRGMTQGSRSRNHIICYSCGQPGHRSFECPGTGSGWGGNTTHTPPPPDHQLENFSGSAVTPSQAPRF
ncbi:paraneoplastic antigen Ma3 homolog [Pseudophryne corroboree]|uniref:paraneoplastic antigen Ma3 homolog n=1 Tax=Pseudophryne corroboree TaxID=495146 RepID=UPI0030812D3E